MLCQLVFQPVITIIHFVVSIVEFVLQAICRFIQEIVNVLKKVLKWVCNNVVHTVCSTVCKLLCGICDFFCGIFGCDCGCKNVCNKICKEVTDVVCGWVHVLEHVLESVTRFVCNYIIQTFIRLLNVLVAFVTMVLTWICTLIDVVIIWFLCWSRIGEIFNNTDPRRFRVAPKIIRNNDGYSDWFVYVNNPDANGVVHQSTRGYILSDTGKPLTPVVDPQSGDINYYEVETHGDFITGDLKRHGGPKGEYVSGNPFLYYPHKVMEIASHLFSDIFASDPSDDGTGSDVHKNLLSYNSNVQAWLDAAGKLSSNSYNNWSGKYSNPGPGRYFGDKTLPDMGTRVDSDSTCSHPTNTALSVVNEDIQFTPPDTGVAEDMKCGASQTLTLDQTNFLLNNKDSNASAVTTYFVSEYDMDDSSVGCNDLLGYTIITFRWKREPIFTDKKVLQYKSDANAMMARVVENLSSDNQRIVRVAETYLHECGHQCGLLHDTDAPDCENDTTLHISKVMNPNGDNRRAYTRSQWCRIRLSAYVTRRELPAFLKAPELPDSGSVPPGKP